MRIQLRTADITADRERWKPWFAWRPVRVGDHLVWMEMIERRRVSIRPVSVHGYQNEYRFHGKT